jgi:hypothetical protein
MFRFPSLWSFEFGHCKVIEEERPTRGIGSESAKTGWEMAVYYISTATLYGAITGERG